MSILQKLKHIVEEPPPELILEFSEAGIAWARRGVTVETGFAPLDPSVLSVSPVRDNVLAPDKLDLAIQKLVPAAANKKRRPTAVILPDFCGRVAVLDFDSLPSDPAEQLSLVRFRVKKSVPFDLEAASVSFAIQPHGSGKRRDVVVAVVAHEILARYEAPLRMAGLHPGLVTISALAAMNLVHDSALAVTAKLSGKVLSVAVTENETLRLFRCVELDHVTPEEITAVLFPTLAFVEDELKRRPQRLMLCGFGAFGDSISGELARELNVSVESLRSPWGAPTPFNAGLMGYLQSAGLSIGAAA